MPIIDEDYLVPLNTMYALVLLNACFVFLRPLPNPLNDMLRNKLCSAMARSIFLTTTDKVRPRIEFNKATWKG